jgi:PAS domain S-box-containing protein
MFWALVIYTYLLLMTGSLVVTHSYWKARQLHRKQMAAVMVGVLPPWLANLFYVLELEIIHGLDPTPFAFTFSGLVFAWAIFRLRLLKLVPIARERVLDLMQDAVIVLDQEDRVVDLNPSGLHLALSYKGRIWGRRLAKALPELAMEASQRKPGENQVEFTYGGLRPSRIYEVRTTPLFDQEEAYIGKVLILRDVTEHQRAEQALIQSEAKHRSILESIEEGFYEVDRHGRFTMVNRAMCDLMGQNRYKLLGNDIRDYMRKEQALAVTEAANQIYRSGHSMGSMEWLFSTPGGDLVQMESSVTLIKTKDGKISGFRGICRDVTTRKKAEEERILREKYQAAIETAGAACHELNQPLQSILILIELILTTVGPDTALQPKFQQLVTESNRMAKITRRLINLTDYRTRNYVGDMKILELVDDPERN